MEVLAEAFPLAGVKRRWVGAFEAMASGIRVSFYIHSYSGVSGNTANGWLPAGVIANTDGEHEGQARFAAMRKLAWM